MFRGYRYVRTKFPKDYRERILEDFDLSLNTKNFSDDEIDFICYTLLDKAVESIVNYIIDRDLYGPNDQQFVKGYIQPVKFNISTRHDLMNLFSLNEEKKYFYAKREYSTIHKSQFKNIIQTKYKDLAYLVIEFLLYKLPAYNPLIMPLLKTVKDVNFVQGYRNLCFRNKYHDAQVNIVGLFIITTKPIQKILYSAKNKIIEPEPKSKTELLDLVNKEYLKERKRRIIPFLKKSVVSVEKEAYTVILIEAIKEKISGSKQLMDIFETHMMNNVVVLEKDLHMILNAIYFKQTRIGSLFDFVIGKRLDEKMEIVKGSLTLNNNL